MSRNRKRSRASIEVSGNKYFHHTPKLYKYGNSEASPQSNQAVTLAELRLPHPASVRAKLKPFVPMLSSGEVICGYVFIKGVRGKFDIDMITTTNSAVAKAQSAKNSWSKVFIRVDPTIAMLACYISETSKRAVEMIELKDSNIRLIGKSSKDPKGFISWQIKDRWNQTYTLATPDKKITQTWTEAMRFMILEVCKVERRNLFQEREARKERKETVFKELKKPPPDQETIRLQSLIAAATEGDLDAVRNFLKRPISDTDIPTYSKYERPAKLSPAQPVMENIEIWQEEIGTIEKIKVNNKSNVKDLLHSYGYAVGQDVLRGQVIGVQLTTLKHRSAQIIQSYIRGMITRARYTTKFSKGPKSRFVKRKLQQKNINRVRKYYEENPLKLHQMRLRKRKKKEMESPYDKYSDHLQRLMAFAPHRTENMVRLIQTTYRGYVHRKTFREAILQVRRNAAAIQGWYRTMVSLYWRLRHNRARTIEKYERRRQAYVKLAILRKDALEFIEDIVENTLLTGTIVLVRARIAIRWLKMKIFRMRFKKLKAAEIRVAAWWRGIVCKIQYQYIRYRIVRAQALYRSVKPYRTFQIKWKLYRKAALAIQGWWRAGTLPYLFQRKRRSVTYISKWYRCHHQRKIYADILRGICKVQAFYRRNVALGEYRNQRNAVTIIAAAARRRQYRENYKKQKGSTLMLQMRIRIMLAKKALRVQQHYFRMLILVQKNSRRFLVWPKYLAKISAAICLQQWWRGLVFSANANSHMAKIRTASTIIQKFTRRHLAVTNHARWIKEEYEKVLLWPDQDNSTTIYQSNMTCEDGTLVLINISSCFLGLAIKAVDLSEGHKKSWDIEFSIPWHNLLILVFLDPRLNRCALSPDVFVKKLAYVLCHPVPSRTMSQLIFENGSGENKSKYLYGYSKLTHAVRLPISFQKYMANLYDNHLSSFFINRNQDELEVDDKDIVLCNPIRSDIKEFQNTISKVKTGYDMIKKSFLSNVHNDISNTGAYNIACYKRMLSILLSSIGTQKINSYMDLLKEELQKSTIFRTEIVEQILNNPDELCSMETNIGTSSFSRLIGHNTSSDFSTNLLQNMTPQIMLPMLQRYLQSSKISLRNDTNGKIHFRIKASKFIQWTLLLQFIQYCNDILSEDNTKVKEVNTQLAYWFQTFRGSMSGQNEIPSMLPQIKVTSLVHATFISSCEKKHSITSLLPALLESVEILRQDWYQGFQKSTNNFTDVIEESMKEVFSESGTGVGRIMLRAFEDEMYGSSKIIVEHSNNSAILENLVAFPVLCSEFRTKEFKSFYDCEEHFKILLPVFTKCIQDIWKTSLQSEDDNERFCLRKAYDDIVDTQTLNTKWRDISTLLRSLGKMNTIMQASEIQEHICHDVVVQVNKQQFEQEKNVKYWDQREKESQPNLDFELGVLRKKQIFIVGEEYRPDKVDLATFKYHEAIVEVKEKEVGLCKNQLETVRGACLDMESDVSYAKKEIEKIALIRDAQKEWEYILKLFIQHLDAYMSECNSRISDSEIKRNGVMNSMVILEKQLFAFGLTRQLGQCDIISRKISELKWQINLIESNAKSINRQVHNYLVQISTMIYHLGNAYLKWCLSELEGYKARKRKMEKAIVVMNSTNDRLDDAEREMKDEINKCEKFILSFKLEQLKVMESSPNYWWYTYSNNHKQIKTWHHERKKDKYREHLVYLEKKEIERKIREEARKALKDDDELSTTSSSSHAESEGSVLADDSAAFETASEDESQDDADSMDSYDFRFDDLEDLTFENIFMPLKERREMLYAKRMGEKKTKVKKAVKIWSEIRRKTILRKVRQRTVQHEWENIHFKFEELEKVTSQLAEDIRAYAPRFLLSFEGVAIQSVLKNINILVAHADWQDIHEISEKCEEVISKLNQAYNMLDPLFHRKNEVDDQKGTGETTEEGSKDQEAVEDNNDEQEDKPTFTLCPKTDLSLSMLTDIVDVQSMIKDCQKSVDYIMEQHDKNTIFKREPFEMEGIDHRKYTRADFMLYRDAFMQSAEKKVIKGKTRYFVSAQRLAKAIELCGRVSVDWGLIPLQLERLYGKSEIEFDDFLHYVNYPRETEIEIKTKYYKHVAKALTNDIDNAYISPVKTRVNKILDRWSPSRRKKIQEDNAVLTLQSWYRMATLRRKYRRSKMPLKQTMKVSAAALKIQGAFWLRGGRQFILQQYILRNYDKVVDPETEHIIYIHKYTKHSLMNLPTYVLPGFIDKMPYSDNPRYTDQKVLNAIRPEPLNEDRKQIIKLKKRFRQVYIKGISKAKKTAERLMITSGVYELPCELIEVPRGLDILIESLNDRQKLENLVKAFTLTTNGLKKALAEWLKVKPADYDLKDGIVL